MFNFIISTGLRFPSINKDQILNYLEENLSWKMLLLCYQLEKVSNSYLIRSVQSLSHVWLFATPWTAARQTSLSITNSWSLLKLMSAMPSNRLIFCHPFLLPSIFPSIKVFPVSQFFASGGQSIGASVSASVLPMNSQGWFPVGLTSLISLLSEGFSRVFFNTTFLWHQFLGTQPFFFLSSYHILTWLLEKP